LIPTWIEAATDAEIPTGLSVGEALRRALDLRERLRAKTPLLAGFQFDAEFVEKLHTLCALLDQAEDIDPKLLLSDCTAAFELISALDWPSGEFGGREDLLSRLAFLCWRYAQKAESPAAESKWRGAHWSIDRSDVCARAERTLGMTEEQRLDRSDELNLDDPEQLLSLCKLLSGLSEVEPARARDEAAFFYRFLESAKRQIGVFDEKDYYLGEFALLAGVACRILSRRDEARRWFELSEANFVLAHNPSAHFARLAYQRLALRLEERDFETILRLAPRWVDCFDRLELREDALKCRFLEAHALKETDHFAEAKQEFSRISDDAKFLQLDRLAAIADQNLFQIHAFLGEAVEALARAREAAAVLGRLNNRVNLAKLQLGVGYFFQGQGCPQDAIVALRDAQRQFAEIGMNADVAATHLVLADLLLDVGQPAQAEWEIRAALPVIDELKLVPEGIAALALLRDSLRRRQIDRQALRSLNGYFEEPRS